MPLIYEANAGTVSTDERRVSMGVDRAPLYFALFFVSGFPALLYQIVWERALFTIYGTNIESVTIIVTIFMLGLGLGSLAGGTLSKSPRVKPLHAFGAIELLVGAFGAVSLWIFHRVAEITAGASLTATGVFTFLLLLIPTLLMGSTLPLLVAHFVRQTRNVGESVAALYSVNTLGSGVACLAAALFLMRLLGQAGSVRLAASLNLLVGCAALVLSGHSLSGPHFSSKDRPQSRERNKTLPLMAAMLLAAVGFISLGYEIIWYRLYSFTSGGTAACFATLLGFYLFGIAYGSFAVRDICRLKLRQNLPRTLEMASKTVMFGSIAGLLVGPAISFAVRYVPYNVTFVFVFIGAALLGAAFPMLSHAAIDPLQEAGSDLSYLYLSNIVGSALGSFLVGFVLMDHWSTKAASFFLFALGVAVTLVLGLLSNPKGAIKTIVTVVPACVVVALLASPLFSHLYERLLIKQDYVETMRFTDLVENRNGVIAVGPNETVYGGGVYDGRFNTSLVNDTNAVFRAYAVAGLHPNPKDVLVIGLSSGSWAQVVANDPDVQRMTIVEINPGYLPLIRRRPAVSSLLRNPKVEIVIDDGRRWLVRNPNRRFDFILMNTTFHWRDNASNLLSTEFCRLLRAHLNKGGIAYYNTTWSGEVQQTGVSAFPFALRVTNFLAVSDSPITLDKHRWRTALQSYAINGHSVFDLRKPNDMARLDQVLRLADQPLNQPHIQGVEIETRAELLARWSGYRSITDDNMGTEWR